MNVFLTNGTTTYNKEAINWAINRIERYLTLCSLVNSYAQLFF